ncbi:ribonuclease P protein subunit p40-like [Cloeon dipterum]|uniref:ribonuclease P protein subunit p40-like n=1 Tax=Cloeon dipterum TaxID=197152 RepID=UPI0032205418
MLAPEVWNFKPPSVALQIEKDNLKRSKHFVEACIADHHFNHGVTLISPSNNKLPGNLTSGPYSDYYKISDLPVVELIRPDFLHNFIQNGKVSMMSVGTKIDCDNCVNISPAGMLIMSLEKVSYERLGLEGKPSFFCRLKPPSRYIVKIDLAAECFKPKKKNYERVFKCLMHNLKLKMDFAVAWDPSDTSVCTSSIAAYFDSLGYKVKTGNKANNVRQMMEVPVPNDLLNVESEEIVGWLGAVVTDCDVAKWFDCSKELLQENDTTDLPVRVYQWTGFHTSQQMTLFITDVIHHVRNQNEIPWIAVHVQGFEDSVVTWKTNENHFHQSAENSYTLIIDPTEQYLLFKTLGANRKAKTHSK